MKKERKPISEFGLSSMSAWNIASHFGCGYFGDGSVIRHGGFFYSTKDWLTYGYADAVEFWEDPDTGECVVSCGTIHRLEGKEMESAWDTIGVEEDDFDARDNVCAQIEACRWYYGIEPDDYEPALNFVIEGDDAVDEEEIWEQVRELLEQLGDDEE